jgi:hypothetical protein
MYMGEKKRIIVRKENAAYLHRLAALEFKNNMKYLYLR